MSRGVFGALKDAVLILDEIRRLNENIRRLVERTDALERRLNEVDREQAVAAVREEALIARFEAATRAAAAQTHAALIERIVRVEHALDAAGKPRQDRPRLGSSGERQDV